VSRALERIGRLRGAAFRASSFGLPLAITLAVILGCGPPGASDLVLITVEALRPDRIGAYGDRREATPNLDQVARAGVVFERAVTPSPSTLASVATILSGLGPHRHGVRDDLRFRLRPEFDTVAERLVRAGYATAGFPGAFSLHGSFGLGRGFVVYDDEIPHAIDPEAAADARRSSDEVTDLALAWLEERPRSPFFLWVHYADARAPRRSTSGGVDSDPYTRWIANIDASIGRLIAGLDSAGAGRERMIVVAATQAESLGENEEHGHGLLTTETTLRIPLIAVGPGLPPGHHSQAWVQASDIAATLLEAAALDTDPDARSLQRSLETARSEDEVTWFESQAAEARLGWSAISGVRAGRWKYTALPAPATLHDVVDDPGETRDRSGDQPERAATLAAAHAALLAQAKPSATESVSDRDRRVALIGHLPGPPSRYEGRIPDPRRSVRAVAWVESAVDLARTGRVADGIGALELLAKSPVARALVLRRLGAVLLLSERPDRAAEVFARLEAITGSLHARVSLAAAELAAGRADEALRILDSVEAERPVVSSRAWLMRGHALLALGRSREALAVAEQLRERRPDDDSVIALESSARTARDGDVEEEARLRQALEGAPSHGDRLQTRLALVGLLVRSGRDREATALVDAAPETSSELLVARARIAARRANPRRATRLYEDALALRPSARNFHRELATLYESEARFDAAARLYAELLETEAATTGLLIDRGAALARSGRSEEAERDYRSALALDPDLPEVHYNLALIALARSDDASAEAGLQRAVTLDPAFSAAHLELSRLYHRRGDARSAEHAARAVATSDPSQGFD
jgi:arylsulfatase A-like enzyme/Flp pilus assembly protein TadD